MFRLHGFAEPYNKPLMHTKGTGEKITAEDIGNLGVINA